ncbi:MAG: hypothetical protein RDU30_13710 [Desulfovibrionaceae bacterium]|nr:hypothetical protein [Desulfovibrionaceae bacterium]
MGTRIIQANSTLVMAMQEAVLADPVGNQTYKGMERARNLLTDPQQLSRLCSACFWASMETEEGRQVRGTLAVCSPSPSLVVRRLTTPVRLGVHALVSLLTASPRASLAVHGGDEGLHLWGMLDAESEGLVRLRIAGNGTLLASQSERVLAIYHKGLMSRPKAVDGPSLVLLLADALHKKQFLELGKETPTQLIRMVTAMIHHGHGGTLVVVEPDDTSWRKGVHFKFTFSGWEKPGLEHQQIMSEALLQRIGELSLIDGAVVVDTDLHLYGFGGKLEMENTTPNVIAVNASSGNIQYGLSLAELGGMRHQSAARFVSEHRTTYVFVVSQDCRLSLFCWSNKHECIAVVQNLEHFLWAHA